MLVRTPISPMHVGMPARQTHGAGGEICSKNYHLPSGGTGMQTSMVQKTSTCMLLILKWNEVINLRDIGET